MEFPADQQKDISVAKKRFLSNHTPYCNVPSGLCPSKLPLDSSYFTRQTGGGGEEEVIPTMKVTNTVVGNVAPSSAAPCRHLAVILAKKHLSSLKILNCIIFYNTGYSFTPLAYINFSDF